MSRPVPAAMHTRTFGGPPGGTSNPRVNNEDPAAAKAVVTPPETKGQNNSA